MTLFRFNGMGFAAYAVPYVMYIFSCLNELTTANILRSTTLVCNLVTLCSRSRNFDEDICLLFGDLITICQS